MLTVNRVFGEAIADDLDIGGAYFKPEGKRFEGAGLISSCDRDASKSVAISGEKGLTWMQECISVISLK